MLKVAGDMDFILAGEKMYSCSALERICSTWGPADYPPSDASRQY